jgi:hypothetical protein
MGYKIENPSTIDENKIDRIHDTLLPQKPPVSILQGDQQNQTLMNDTFNIKKLEEYINNDELIMEESNHSVSSKYFENIKEDKK